MLNHDTRLYPHHIDDQRRYDFSRPAAEVTRHPTNPDVWGLKNISDSKWVTPTTPDAARDMEPGKSVTIADGTRIRFGNVAAEIHVCEVAHGSG